MVDMLIDATKLQKISWQEDVQHNAFYTQINGCKVTIYSVYEISIDESSYSLSLANPNGEVFILIHLVNLPIKMNTKS